MPKTILNLPCNQLSRVFSCDYEVKAFERTQAKFKACDNIVFFQVFMTWFLFHFQVLSSFLNLLLL